jgi:Dolichyl-phosphate-mannose-protein mannosyltransferase
VSRRLADAADLGTLIVAVVLSAGYAIHSARRIGPTFDEPAFLRSGLEHARTGSYRALFKVGTMPLPVDVGVAPLRLLEKQRGSPIDLNKELGSALSVARAAHLVFWAVLLVYAMLLARRLGRPGAGALAVSLIASEPVFLAHAGLATTDIALTAFVLATAFYFLAGRDERWGRRVGLPGLTMGLALLSKGSALAFVPITLLGLEVARPGPREWRDRIRPFLRDLAGIAGVGLLVAFVYAGSDFAPQPSFVEWARGLPGSTGRAVSFVAENLRLFPNAGDGLVRQVRHELRGHSAYLLGHVYPWAIWFYFPVALSAKLTLTLLAAPLALAAVNRQALRNGLLVGAGLLLALSLTFRVQIGVRLVLPLVALGVIGIAVALTETIRSVSLPRRSLASLLAAVAILVSAAESVRVFPHALLFTNELWGGTESGYRVVSDSNYDWGQGVPQLRAWAEGRGLGHLDVWYFGTDPEANRPPLHSLRLLEPHRLADVARELHGNILAVSTTLLFGAYQTELQSAWTPAFAAKEPLAHVATFLIYDMSEERRVAAP